MGDEVTLASKTTSSQPQRRSSETETTVRARAVPPGSFIFKLGHISEALCEDRQPQPGKNKGQPFQPALSDDSGLNVTALRGQSNLPDGGRTANTKGPSPAQGKYGSQKWYQGWHVLLNLPVCPSVAGSALGFCSLLSGSHDQLTSCSRAQSPPKECAAVKSRQLQQVSAITIQRVPSPSFFQISLIIEPTNVFFL